MKSFVRILVVAIFALFCILPLIHDHNSNSANDCTVCVIYKVSSKFKEELSSTVKIVSSIIGVVEFKTEKFICLAVEGVKSRDPPHQS